ncbi:hypothetical protein CGRA01v4_02760 [Colletotrichum graminicola]|uniref:Uncharacterized protein n=1 Tax=Colletotrichum graminicola (strain M1.001 / M2 / FGSC 10212) TaxID=645133 RepID=E3QAC5_COLGM|nr:uncharacterized protein GLRG_02957 [Colletotrichum graminicola M1.001]EFQ27813.1 hypothetical protein GLRG_02957 [Colletotrichum graminicola M1.001]WDK11481.1 hypothetical protein CGRA01v4_02760 [Colletotrichum graminicola]
MSNNQDTQERLSKRSLTPNRPLYNSFNEAHRHIVPVTPRTPIEEELRVEEQLTQEQVEEILKVSNASRQLKGQDEAEQPQQSVAENQSGHESKFTNQSSASAIEFQTKTTDQGPHASVSLCRSDNENAFVDSSVSSIQESKDQVNQYNATDNPFSGQQATFDCPDASSFYPEDGDDYYPASTDDDSFEDKVKLEPKSSPALASSPTLPPPIAPDSKHPPQQLLQSHLDDVIKKKHTLDNLEATHLSGQNGTQYPIFIDRGVLPPPAIPATQAFSITEHTTRPESHYEGDISDISEGQFIGEDKGKASVSRLNPFHAFSGISSHASDTDAQPSEPEDNKVFLRPHAEKEVSRALHHATGLSLPSTGLIVRQGLSSRTYNSQQSPYRMRSSQQKKDFYHAPAIQSNWQITQSGIKVPVSTLQNVDEVDMQATEPYSAIDNTRMATVASGDTENRTGLEGDEDWRTVTDDREFLTGAVGRVMTGSSIANVSDTLLVQKNQRTGAPTSRKTSATKAWWEKSNQPLSMPSRSPSPSFIRPPSRVFQQRQLNQEGWEEIELEPMPTPYRDFSWPRIRAERERAQQAMEVTQPANSAYANLPFPLVALEDAARRQAVRRASGLEDQTLSGRILSPGLPLSSQGGSHALPRPAMRKDSARSIFSRIKNSDFDCRNHSTTRHRENTFGQPAHEYCSTQYSGRAPTPLSRERASTAATARRNATASHQAAVEALANDPSAGRRSSPHLYSEEVMARYRALQAVRQLGGQGTDSELADMAASVRDLPLSERAVLRQKAFYYAIMATTGVLPFVGFAILALSGDTLLAAITRGECSGLSFHQRRNLRIMLLVGCGVWVVAFAAGLISLLALRN